MNSGIHRRALAMASLICATLPAVCGAQPAGAPAAQAAGVQAGAAPSDNVQAQQASLQAANRALQWPRTLDAANGMHVQLYQPQIDSWNGDQIGGRMAVAVGQANGSPTYGVVQFSARADVNKPAGLVYVDRIRIEKIDLPPAPQNATQLRGVLESHIPPSMTTRLEALQTSYAVSQKLASLPSVPVKNTPPAIIFRSVPTILVLVDGPPSLYRVQGAEGWQRVANTRALMLADSAGYFYLNVTGHWFQASAATGPWQRLDSPSQPLLSAAQASSHADKPDPMLPRDGQPSTVVPRVLVQTGPAELVITSGAPEFAPVQGTGLLSMTNADHAVFMNPSNNRYYILVSGRWFSASQLDGPWAYVPGKQLPRDFGRIDPHDPSAGVLASVPGTPQARESVIAATIPQTATAARDKAALTVAYLNGPPDFVDIPGTQVQYAANSQTPVFRVDGAGYYALYNGIWFTASSSAGPWRVADHVAPAIYTIPVSSALHYVTYVRVYGATPTSVVYGYTPGYMGVMVAPDGTVVYGTGYVYPAYVAGPVYVGYPPTYGYNAAFDTAVGFAFGFAAGSVWGAPAPYWGPYWGAPYWRGVNVNSVDVYGHWGGTGVVTHATGWNGWTGTQWQGTHAEGYNPATGRSFEGTHGAAYNWQTGNYASGYRGAYNNPVNGTAGASRGGVVGNADNGTWAAGQQNIHTNDNTGRTTASSRTASGEAGKGVTSYNNEGVTHSSRTGNTVGWDDGNVYGDHNGNVYRHTDDGWQQHSSSGWQPMTAGNTDAANRTYLNQQQQARSTADNYTSGRYDDAAMQDRGWGNRGFNGSGWGGGDRFGGGGERFGGGRFRR
ncbi:carbohydrate-binding family V/XII [Bordetella sp. H567]|uniref:carbohydrate-binding family V/XII n=1 Tax=Bordetella sp. H567 TaxID=1697043 RepID=UPI00081CC421|nr:carbohydrate-binding family V/XII [Bordetella sp. H567]AOB31411.1 carbohydrate-binding family V/XII [Bordetella sp. H567]